MERWILRQNYFLCIIPPVSEMTMEKLTEKTWSKFSSQISTWSLLLVIWMNTWYFMSPSALASWWTQTPSTSFKASMTSPVYRSWLGASRANPFIKFQNSSFCDPLFQNIGKAHLCFLSPSLLPLILIPLRSTTPTHQDGTFHWCLPHLPECFQLNKHVLNTYLALRHYI